MPSLSLKSKQTQLVVAGIAATAVVGLLVYSRLSSKSVATTKKPKKLDDDDDDLLFVDPRAPVEGSTGKGGGNKAVDYVDTASDATPRKSNESGGPKPKKAVKSSPTASDEKQIHTTIEALDKKGKTFFKNKQVRPNNRFFTKKTKFLNDVLDDGRY